MKKSYINKGIVVISILMIVSMIGVVVVSANNNIDTSDVSLSMNSATENPGSGCKFFGESSSIIACGIHDVSTDVEINSQNSDGGSVKLRAVALENGGFIGIHKKSYIDGKFKNSLIGTSNYLQDSLYENIDIDLDKKIQKNTTLLAVAYKDSNNNKLFDFPTLNGGGDRPYTNTYTMDSGLDNDAGKVIGDYGKISVIKNIINRYDTNENQKIEIDELHTAIIDFTEKNITRNELRKVIKKYVRTQI